MKRLFATIVLVDVTLLLIPTRWMGNLLEVVVASTLALGTAFFWLALRFSDEEL